MQIPQNVLLAVTKPVLSEREALQRVRRVDKLAWYSGDTGVVAGFLLAAGIVWAVLDPSSNGAALVVLTMGAVTAIGGFEHWLFNRESRRLKERTGCPTLTEYEAFYMMKIFLARLYNRTRGDLVAALEKIKLQPADIAGKSAAWRGWRSTVSAHSTPILAWSRPGVSEEVLRRIQAITIKLVSFGSLLFIVGIVAAIQEPSGPSSAVPALPIILGGIGIGDGLYLHWTIKRHFVRILNQTDYPALTDHEAFDAMRCFLATYREGSNGNLAALIEDTGPQLIGAISNSAAWQDWLLSVKQVKGRASSGGSGCP